MLFTERAAHLKDHAGQISFPGGRLAPARRRSRRRCARPPRRSASRPQDVDVLGCLDVHSTVTGFVVTPVVGWVSAPFEPRPDPLEVASVFEVPLDFLLDPANIATVVSRAARHALSQLRAALRRSPHLGRYGRYAGRIQGQNIQCQNRSDRASIEKLLEIMATLRDPAKRLPVGPRADFRDDRAVYDRGGLRSCGRDRPRRPRRARGELGDLLFQVVFHARLAEEAGAFDFGDVVERICAKMRRRHPHVFGDAVIATAAEQTQAWEELKEQDRAGSTSVLDDVPVGLPALTRAVKLGRRAGAVGFDWPDVASVRTKLSEEIDELDGALATQDRERAAAEIGDVLLTAANLCRHLELDPETCIRRANARFETDSAASKSGFRGSAATGISMTSMRSRCCGSKPKPSVDACSGSIHGSPRNVRSKIRKDRQRKESVMWGKSFAAAVLVFGVAGVAGASQVTTIAAAMVTVWASRIDRVRVCACRRCRSAGALRHGRAAASGMLGRDRDRARAAIRSRGSHDRRRRGRRRGRPAVRQRQRPRCADADRSGRRLGRRPSARCPKSGLRHARGRGRALPAVSERFTEERIDGYLVTYQYQGRHYTMQTDVPPGDRVRLAVDVRPMPYRVRY